MSRTVAPLRGLTLKQLSSELGVDRHELRWLTRRGAHLYDERRLSKKGNGSRRLLVPTPRLKLFQRAFYKKYLRDHAYHPAAYCVRGRGILDAVRQHRSRTHLLHLDITDFFPSVDCGDVRDCLRREGVSKDAVPTIARLFTCENQLPQGAPTSVAIGNLVLHPLDVRLTGYCRKPGAGLTYTRYVDDITISGGSRLAKFQGGIRKIVKDCGWVLNQRSRLLGPDEEHLILGILAGRTLALDEDYVSDVEAALNTLREARCQLAPETARSLRGKIAWIRAVEPDRGRRLDAAFQQLLGGEPREPLTQIAC